MLILFIVMCFVSQNIITELKAELPLEKGRFPCWDPNAHFRRVLAPTLIILFQTILQALM